MGVAQGATLPQRSRWVTASKQTSISASVMASSARKQQSAKVQNDFEISQTDAFAAPGFHLALADSSI
jgi:hypothetical protein